MTQGRPTAAPAHFPYDHPNMAVVMAEEARGVTHDTIRQLVEPIMRQHGVEWFKTLLAVHGARRLSEVPIDALPILFRRVCEERERRSARG